MYCQKRICREFKQQGSGEKQFARPQKARARLAKMASEKKFDPRKTEKVPKSFQEIQMVNR